LKLILVRHAETIWNKDRRIQGGSSDIALSEVGIRQAHLLAKFFQGENITAIASSPLQRALDTAKVIAEPHGLQVKEDAGFKELEVGELEGLSWSNLGTSFTQFLLQKWQGGGTGSVKGGESFVQLQQRSWDSVEQLRRECDGDTAIVVSHYFATLSIIFKALGLLPEYLPKFRIANGGISIIEFSSYGPRLITFNNTSFLNCGKG
jgi:broad specificity phosphatase PhoE